MNALLRVICLCPTCGYELEHGFAGTQRAMIHPANRCPGRGQVFNLPMLELTQFAAAGTILLTPKPTLDAAVHHA